MRPSYFETRSGNSVLAQGVLQEVISHGVAEFCVCPGARNAPLVYPLSYSNQVKIYYWPEERSAAFFAIGRMKAIGGPVAVVTTSGTAAAELLPAAMEAYYTGLPLVLITADRPRRFRGTGAPQSAEQVGLYGCYVSDMQDLADGDACCLDNWTQEGPIHLNLCFEEPNDSECQTIRLEEGSIKKALVIPTISCHGPKYQPYLSFLQKSRFPLVVIGAMASECREAAICFLLKVKAPLYAEAISGIREDARLERLRIQRIEDIWATAAENGYPIDGILRLGGIPTARFWRDLEDKMDEVSVCSVSEHPFSGLTQGDLIHTSLASFFAWSEKEPSPDHYPYEEWKTKDQRAHQHLLRLFQEEPLAEASLIHHLSERIPFRSKVYLGNSLPIREWDQAASYHAHHFQMACNRGVNGIDGQLATFFGFCSSEQENWAILGDLTVLYDLVAPWITSQLSNISANIVIVNNGGGQIFSRMFSHPVFQNHHQLNFEPLADFWGLRYERWQSIPDSISPSHGGRLIELIPNQKSTARFLKKYSSIRGEKSGDQNVGLARIFRVTS
ncbi:MAG: 2-succinyl-5-enolpyruvyl-6-hydroxy-3-cyclohexene-1-carboxylic-acid synthase [Parachlamydiaceae bacterium]